MEKVDFRENNLLIKRGILLELTALTIWKVCSAISVELIIYMSLIVILALTGIFVLICGLTKTELKKDSHSWFFNSNEKIYVWAVALSVIFSVWHLAHIATQLDSQSSWWMEQVAVVGDYNYGLTACFFDCHGSSMVYAE